MPAGTQDVPLVAVHNNLETFFNFLRRADDPDIFRKRRYRGDRGLFWLGDPKLLFATTFSPDAGQVCRLWGYPGTTLLAPAEPTHQLCLDILREPQLFNSILDYAGPGRSIRLVPYATTAELHQLAEALRGHGLEVFLPESPSPDHLWLRDYADSKSGFRTLVSRCLPTVDALPPGFVCRDPSRAAAVVEWFLERGQACVVKADSGESGIGHIIFTPGPARPPSVLQALEQNPFLQDDLIVVEQYIDSPGQLSPSPELFVPPAGSGEVRITYMTQQLFSSFGRFSGVLISRSLEQADWYPVLCDYGLKIGAALQEMGYVGPFDLDAIVDDRGHLYLLETNTRRTGGTYVHEFACHTFGADYLQRVTLLSMNAVSSGGILSLDELLERLSDLLYPEHGSDSGVVVTVTSTLPAGEFGCILIAPDEAGVYELNEQLSKRLQAQQCNNHPAVSLSTRKRSTSRDHQR